MSELAIWLAQPRETRAGTVAGRRGGGPDARGRGPHGCGPAGCPGEEDEGQRGCRDAERGLRRRRHVGQRRAEAGALLCLGKNTARALGLLQRPGQPTVASCRRRKPARQPASASPASQPARLGGTGQVLDTSQLAVSTRSGQSYATLRRRLPSAPARPPPVALARRRARKRLGAHQPSVATWAALGPSAWRVAVPSTSQAPAASRLALGLEVRPRETKHAPAARVTRRAAGTCRAQHLGEEGAFGRRIRGRKQEAAGGSRRQQEAQEGPRRRGAALLALPSPSDTADEQQAVPHARRRVAIVLRPRPPDGPAALAQATTLAPTQSNNALPRYLSRSRRDRQLGARPC